MARTSDILNSQQVIDQMGRNVDLPLFPKRVVSLVPSITEYLVDIGLGDRLVGRTKFCIRPKAVLKKVKVIGGTKQFNFDAIKELHPDLIIGNKEENYQDGIEILAENYPVWMSDVQNMEQNYDMMMSLGVITGCESQAGLWASKVRENFKKYYKRYSGRVLYMIWRKPYMAAGSDTFISHVLDYLGYENAVLQRRYPEIDPFILEELKPDQIFLSSEPFPFKIKHVQEMESLQPSAKARLVDGEAFSWYGSRLAKVTFDF